jgi:hypothetical protein
LRAALVQPVRVLTRAGSGAQPLFSGFWAPRSGGKIFDVRHNFPAP